MLSDKSVSLDIKIQSGNDDVILFKGPPQEASSVLLSGTISLTVSKPIKVKSVSLKLTGRLNYNVPVLKSGNDLCTNSQNLNVDRRIFHYKWDDISIDNYFKGLYNNYQTKKPIDNSIKNQINYKGDLKRPKSTTSLISLRSNQSSLPFQKKNSHTLLKGHYEFPFTSILPGDMNESIDGLPNTHLNYYLEASIERSHGKSDLYCRKYLRIVRTITPDNPEISETVNVTDTWPDRIYYSISVPAKTIAIGSKIPLNISIIPFRSEIKLKSIKITLCETAEYCNHGVRSKIRRPIGTLKVKNPEKRLIKLIDDNKFQEKWELDLPFTIPANLSQCTQDCKIFNELRVTHNFKATIYFTNPDGHISKLKANIPVHLFISEFIPLKVQKLKSTTEYTSVSRDININSNKDSVKDTIFRSGSIGLISNQNTTESHLPVDVLNDLLAPPEYESHVFDRLFSNDPEIDSSVLPPPSRIDPELLDYHPDETCHQDDILKNIHYSRRCSDASFYTMPETSFESTHYTHDIEPQASQQHFSLEFENYTFKGKPLPRQSSRVSSYKNVPLINENEEMPPPSYTVNDKTTDSCDTSVKVSIDSLPIPPTAHYNPESQKDALVMMRKRALSTSTNNQFLEDIRTNSNINENIFKNYRGRKTIDESSVSLNIFNLPNRSPPYNSSSSIPKNYKGLHSNPFLVQTFRNGSNVPDLLNQVPVSFTAVNQMTTSGGN